MKLENRNVKQVQVIREYYSYDDLAEREKHLEEMQIFDWQVEKTDRRKETGYMAVFIKQVPIKYHSVEAVEQ